MSVTLIDPRGPRFGAAITSVVLASALVLLEVSPTLAAVVLFVQAVVFGLGAIVGLQAQPYGLIYKKFVRPFLGSPQELEDVRPPRFAQAVGLAFAVVGFVSLVLGLQTIALVAVAAALSAAFLNAAFNFCLGCEMYLLIARIRVQVNRRALEPNR